MRAHNDARNGSLIARSTRFMRGSAQQLRLDPFPPTSTEPQLPARHLNGTLIPLPSSV
jgi:hypothetical protein